MKRTTRAATIGLLLIITFMVALAFVACRQPDDEQETTGEETTISDITSERETTDLAAVSTAAEETEGKTETTAENATETEEALTQAETEYATTEDFTTSQEETAVTEETATETEETATEETTAAEETTVRETTAAEETTAEETTTEEETTELIPSQVPQETMPRISINTDSGEMIEGSNLEKDYYHSTLSVSLCEEEFRMKNVGVNVRVRGNSTATAPKKPLRLTFDTKQSMLGLNDGRKYKSWCLLADYFDASMLRNYGVFQYADVLLDDRWYSSDCQHVEVYINGQYQGVYLLCEQTQIKKGRVEIGDKEETDLSVETGYLLIGQGGIPWEENIFSIPFGHALTDRNGKTMNYGGIRYLISGDSSSGVDDAEDGYTEAHREYVNHYVAGVFQVMYSAIYENKYYSLDRSGNLTVNRELTNDKTMTAQEKQIAAISAVFDIESAVRMCLLDEIAKNLDAMTFNMYVDLSPNGRGVLTLAAPWDFDFSMANTGYAVTHSTDGWYAMNWSESSGVRVNFITVMLGKADWFYEKLKAVWQANYDEIRHTTLEILAESYRYDAAFTRDWNKWGSASGRITIGEHHCLSDLRKFQTHESNALFVADWLTRRIAWINSQLGDGSQPEEPGEPGEPGQPTEQSPLLLIDFTDEESFWLLDNFRRCEGEITENGLMLWPTAEARDPHVNLNYTLLGQRFNGEDYPYLEITYMIPEECSKDVFYMELFLCAGDISVATEGYSTGVSVTADGQYHKVKINLSATGMWDGQINMIRIDFFAECAANDYIYIKQFDLLTQ